MVDGASLYNVLRVSIQKAGFEIIYESTTQGLLVGLIIADMTYN